MICSDLAFPAARQALSIVESPLVHIREDGIGQVELHHDLQLGCSGVQVPLPPATSRQYLDRVGFRLLVRLLVLHSRQSESAGY